MEGNDLLLKIALMVLGTMFTAMSIILVWGFQKLITTLLQHSNELLKIEHRLGEIEKKMQPVDKLQGDLNICFQRVKTLEEKTKEI